jgi:DNA-binding NtrC family response regulator
MIERHWQVVVVSSNLAKRRDVADVLVRLGIDPIPVAMVAELHEISRQKNIGLIFCDRKMIDGDYRDVLSVVASTSRVVMMSEFESPEEYNQARRSGLFDIISSPSRATDIEWMVIQARRDRRIADQPLDSSLELPILHRTARVGR